MPRSQSYRHTPPRSRGDDINHRGHLMASSNSGQTRALGAEGTEMQFCRVTASPRNSRKRSPKRIMHELSLIPLERGGKHSYCFWTCPSRGSAGGLRARVPLPLVVVSTAWLMTLPHLPPALPAGGRNDSNSGTCPPGLSRGAKAHPEAGAPDRAQPCTLVHSGERQARVSSGKCDSELWH